MQHPPLDAEQLRSYCLSKPAVEETWPFGPEVTVFKVKGKMFALSDLQEEPLKVNLKCEPDLSEMLRPEFEAVQPGYHMNKRHWNTVTLGADLPREMEYDLIDRSYALVIKSLPKKVQKSLELLLDA